MLGFVQNWLSPWSNPIGVDFGTDCLRLAQVQWDGSDYRLAAAASAEVPAALRDDPAGRRAFFVENVRDLLVQGGFRGRSAVLALPAAETSLRHVRLPKQNADATKRATAARVRGAVSGEPDAAVIRHVVAGEVVTDGRRDHEIVCMAARRDRVLDYLAAAADARLSVAGMNVEPLAVLDCFMHVYRRNVDEETTRCYVDLGAGGTRVFVVRGGRLLFARSIPVGSDEFTRAVAEKLGVGFDDARVLRLKLSHGRQTDGGRREAALAVANGAKKSSDSAASDTTGHTTVPSHEAARLQRAEMERACALPLANLIAAIDRCRHDHQSTFPDSPIDRLVLIGGEARYAPWRESLAGGLGIPAEIGDPLCRMSKACDAGVESGIDRRQPQPAWAVALGLSLGPAESHRGGISVGR